MSGVVGSADARSQRLRRSVSAGNELEMEPSMSAESCPVTDWQTDFDHTDPVYAADAPAVWDELRATCPVAHSERFGGMWMPTRHEDVSTIAHDTEHFSSRGVIVSVFEPD